MPKLTQTIPALPVRDMTAAVAFYRDRLGFEIPYQAEGFARVVRDDVELHLWESGDEEWHDRADFTANPVRSGAEDFIAGTASCRIACDDVDGLFEEYRASEVLHPVARDGPEDTEWGTREFGALDLDGNLLGFFRWRDA